MLQLYHNIKSRRKELGMTQTDLAHKTGYADKSMIAKIEKGLVDLTQSKILIFAKALNTEPGTLMGDLTEAQDIKPILKTKKAVSINVLGRVAAGIPLNAIEYVIDTEEIPEDLAKTGYFFGLKIKGNSMEPEIKNNDVVIVRQQAEAESGDIVIAMVNGDDAVCKRLKIYADKLALISINSEYDPMIFSSEDIEQKPVKIIGKVVEIRRKL
ncbi:MAG: LexA family transcriptional regulator [Lachnospiraceae bacterium]|nr:LexA family transcriptional regulator [Lachnospiraceae bacterium]MBQ9608130.1 LexA family transcriptional regulator [Lachnospiraceae bacterium]